MLELGQVRDYIKTSQIADHYYIGKLDSKKEKSIGVYQLQKRNEYTRAIGEESNNTINYKGISVLVHWNKNASDTEKIAFKLFDFLKSTQPKTMIGRNEISYIQMINNEPIDVSTDEFGIYERVIEFIVYYKTIEGDKI